MKNWIPISLLNTDLKIFSKALAAKLKSVLPSLIASHQTAYFQNRDIGDAVGRLTHFSPVSYFCTPWKRQKTKSFLTFSEGIEMWHSTNSNRNDNRNVILDMINSNKLNIYSYLVTVDLVIFDFLLF